MCDNNSTINISNNPMMQSRTKHITIRYHFLKERVVKGEVKLDFVPTIEKVTDIFTKPFPKEFFEYLHKKLRVVSFSKH